MPAFHAMPFLPLTVCMPACVPDRSRCGWTFPTTWYATCDTQQTGFCCCHPSSCYITTHSANYLRAFCLPVPPPCWCRPAPQAPLRCLWTCSRSDLYPWTGCVLCSWAVVSGVSVPAAGRRMGFLVCCWREAFTYPLSLGRTVLCERPQPGRCGEGDSSLDPGGDLAHPLTGAPPYMP